MGLDQKEIGQGQRSRPWRRQINQRLNRPINRWILGLLIGLGLAASSSLWLPAQAASDIQTHWARPCIEGLVARGALSLDDQGNVQPNRPVSRADYAVMLNQAYPGVANRQATAPLPPYRDFNRQDPRAAAIAAAYATQFLPHTWDDQLHPNQPMQRAEVLVSLTQGLVYPYQPRANALLSASLADQQIIPNDYREGVAAALGRGVIVNHSTLDQLQPTRPVTRGELAATFCRALPHLGLVDTIPDQVIVPLPTLPPQAIPDVETRGVWLTNIDSEVLFSRNALVEAVERLKTLNFNTLYPTVWNWGYTLYPSQVMDQAIGVRQWLLPQRYDGEPIPERDMLQELLDLAHAEDLSVIPWFEFGFKAPADWELVERHPDWISQKQDGSTITPEGNVPRVWLNPFHPEVQQFMLQVIDELMTNYEVDGFQVDDHFGLPIAYGYDPYTLELYRSEHNGQDPPEDISYPAWKRWRADKISDFLGQVQALVKARRPQAVMSVSPNPYPFSYDFYLQDWPTWQQRGYVDELLVQVYRNNLERFTWEMSRPTAQIARDRIPTGIGILSGLRALPVPISRLQEQIVAARDRNYAGIAFFFYESLWNYNRESPSQRAAAVGESFAVPARRADRPRSVGSPR
jgi:uncharacterized lipoprotein YddW (UPF0748 family)